jgi:hypothetical protein
LFFVPRFKNVALLRDVSFVNLRVLCGECFRVLARYLPNHSKATRYGLKRYLRHRPVRRGTPFVNFRVLCTASVFLISAILGPEGQAKTKSRTSPVVDQNYIAALATANRFLYAWQNHDQETALLLLTDAAKNRISEDQLSALLEGSAPVTYEITRGKKLNPGRYAFPIALFQPTGQHRWMHPHYSQLIILNTGKDGWAIDKLP